MLTGNGSKLVFEASDKPQSAQECSHIDRSRIGMSITSVRKKLTVSELKSYHVTIMAERIVGAREAKQQFSTLLAATEREGITVVITRRGRVVARLIPESSTTNSGSGKETMDALFERYSRPMGGKPFSREDLYDRGELGS